METKPLLYGLIGFFIGGLLVSVVASMPDAAETTMSGMVSSLEDKRGDAYDKAFIEHMIDHHEGAVDMARLSAERAKHEEIKELSQEIIKAQESEIDMMRKWQRDWGYAESSSGEMTH